MAAASEGGGGGEVTIWHNPACGTSRKVLAMLRDRGLAPVVVEYLTSPPGPAELGALLRAAGLAPRQALRTKGGQAAALGLLDPALPDAVILQALHDHPALLERPLVASPRGVRLGRPPEAVLEILPDPAR